MAKKLPSQKYLQDCFYYNPESGILHWKERPREHFKSERLWITWNNRFSNKLALSNLNHNGYLVGSLDGKTVRANRVIYKLWTGQEPEVVLHTSGNLQDNRIGSLFAGTQSINMLDQKKPKNNTSGVVGVTWHKIANKWMAKIKLNGKSKYIGLFDSIELATAARKSVEQEFGFHPNHGLR